MAQWRHTVEGRALLASPDFEPLKERIRRIMAKAPNTHHEDEPDLHGTSFGPVGKRELSPKSPSLIQPQGATADVFDIWQLDITGRVVQFCGTGGDLETAKEAVEGRWMDALWPSAKDDAMWVPCSDDRLSGGVGPYHLDGTEFYVTPQNVALFAVEPRKKGMHFRDLVGLRLGFEIPDPPEPPVEAPAVRVKKGAAPDKVAAKTGDTTVVKGR